jgi:hypothetical protein
MGVKREIPEHIDLEERFQISASVEFDCSPGNFDGLNPIKIEIKKKKQQKIEIQNVELRKPSKGSLF